MTTVVPGISVSLTTLAAAAFGGSANGKTPAFGAGYRGSNPCPPVIEDTTGDPPAGAPSAPLARNREFTLLWSGQALCGLGSQLSSVAYPLLVLAVTGS